MRGHSEDHRLLMLAIRPLMPSVAASHLPTIVDGRYTDALSPA